MSIADKQYLSIVEHILDHGYYADNRTGVPAYKLPHQMMQFDLSEEFPILTTKFVAFKTAVKELLWIWQLQSNDVRELQKMNCHVWDEWMREDGTIGKAYGYQIRKFKQVDTLIRQLKEEPQNRRMIVSLWNMEDLEDMALQPCAFQTLWDVTDGRLNCMLIQRSGDMDFLRMSSIMRTFMKITWLLCARSWRAKTGLQPHRNLSLPTALRTSMRLNRKISLSKGMNMRESFPWRSPFNDQHYCCQGSK